MINRINNRLVYLCKLGSGLIWINNRLIKKTKGPIKGQVASSPTIWKIIYRWEELDPRNKSWKFQVNRSILNQVIEPSVQPCLASFGGKMHDTCHVTWAHQRGPRHVIYHCVCWLDDVTLPLAMHTFWGRENMQQSMIKSVINAYSSGTVVDRNFKFSGMVPWIPRLPNGTKIEKGLLAL